MKILLQLCVICAVCWAGQCIEAALPFSFPASVISLVLLLALLLSGLLKLPRIRETADVFTNNLGLFFIPAGVGLMNNASLIRENAVAFVTILAVSLLVTFAAATAAVRLVSGWMNGREKK